MMIERHATTTLKPRVFEELLKRQHREYFNTQWYLRKPLGIYNVSLANVLESFREVLNELEIVLEKQVFREMPPKESWDKTLVRRQEDLISRLMRHFDDCFNMLCCFFPRPNASPDIKKLRKAQEKVKREPHIKTAWDAVSEYRSHIASVMNHIKHHQGMLRGVVIFNDHAEIPGYFVEYVNQDEAIEPHPDVHQAFKGQATAFSFYRDLRYKLWLVYAVGEDIADAVSQIEPTTVSDDSDLGDESGIVDIVSRIAALPTRVFENEENMPFPHIAVSNENDVTKIQLEFPSRRTILLPLVKPFQVSAIWTGDGVTRSVRPPYFSGTRNHGNAYRV
jgi:hypothetical protein